MVVLKKIKSATLIETLTASVLIVIVFMIASLSFNNIFRNYNDSDDNAIQNRIKELQYLCINDQIILPYDEEFIGWDIEIFRKKNETILIYKRDDKEFRIKI